MRIIDFSNILTACTDPVRVTDDNMVYALDLIARVTGRSRASASLVSSYCLLCLDFCLY